MSGMKVGSGRVKVRGSREGVMVGGLGCGVRGGQSDLVCVCVWGG